MSCPTSRQLRQRADWMLYAGRRWHAYRLRRLAVHLDAPTEAWL